MMLSATLDKGGRGGFPMAMTLNNGLNEVREWAMQHSTGRAFPAKKTAVFSTDEKVLITSFSNWGLGACSWGSRNS